MSNSNSIINIGELSKPATVLIEKISDALGGIFKPFQIIRVAKAEAEADRIRAESQIQVTELHRRALNRFLKEEAKKQSNIENITKQALPLLEEKSLPETVEDDWITNFFDKCRIVSDQQMQQLWAKVLAGEANSPGIFSRKTVNLIADLDKSDAELFTQVCAFSWIIDSVRPLIFNIQDQIYSRNGIDLNSLIHLESLGLLQFNNIGNYARTNLPKEFNVDYFGKLVTITLPEKANNQLLTGHVILTKVGQELSMVCDSKPIEGFFDIIYERWVELSYVPKRDAEAVAKTDKLSKGEV